MKTVTLKRENFISVAALIRVNTVSLFHHNELPVVFFSARVTLTRTAILR